ncbi:Possible protease sohB [Pseudoalteromonas luteoviolacea B = ATCC 29581]|nr:Possible protease sohB [Pseudoalteromonas luteoviolacea B = ATCC 29581]
MEFLYEYGLFLAKALTVVVSILAIIAMSIAAGSKPKRKGSVELTDLSEQLTQNRDDFDAQVLDKKQYKAKTKEQKKESKERLDRKTFVIEFKGSMDAHEVNALREEVTAILTFADKEKDHVLVCLESGGGVVHGYGLGASQLQRIKSAGLPLTVSIDKVAASGGYMMACIADKIIAAPFAIVGSIGVIAQLPNFNKLLKKCDIDYEQVTAGEYKRTLTLFGENTDKGRTKFKEEIEQTHGLFKQFVQEARPQVNIDKVATGEHWFARQAIALSLVDELNTSDDLILDAAKVSHVYKVQYKMKKSLPERLGVGVSAFLDRTVTGIVEKFSYYK